MHMMANFDTLFQHQNIMYLLSMQGYTIPADKLKAISKLIEPWFLFSLVWSIGTSYDGDSKKKFDQYLCDKIKEEKV